MIARPIVYAKVVPTQGGTPDVRAVSVAPEFRAGISLASEGDMGLLRSAANRVRLLRLLGIDPDHAYGLRQVHSRRLVRVDGESSADLAGVEADGMIASEPSAVLTVTVADCLPIFLADRRSGAFALVHSGWKGTGIALDAIRAMCRDGALIPRTSPSPSARGSVPAATECRRSGPSALPERLAKSRSYEDPTASLDWTCGAPTCGSWNQRGSPR